MYRAEAVTKFTNNDDAHRTAVDLNDPGINVVGVIDSRAEVTARGDYPLFTSGHIIGTKGRLGL